MQFGSDSSTQLSAERLILDAVGKLMNTRLMPKRLVLAGGAVVAVDGVSDDETVFVEVFARQGQLKAGQKHKIAQDALKLITIAQERPVRPRIALAFAEPGIKTYLEGRSWLAAAIASWNIEVMVADLDENVLHGIREAQARQIMLSPSGEQTLQG